MSLSTRYMMREPHLGALLRAVIRGFEYNIPQMISFVDTEIDLQPWERVSEITFVSSSEIEVNLMSLFREMMGHASIPAFFGQALMEKYPNLLQDIYGMDRGMMFFLMGLPSWFPWPGVMEAHLARFRLWHAMSDLQRALDAIVVGAAIDSSWGDLEDVSEFIMERHSFFKGKNSLTVK
jgi:hypothetical protein